MSRLSAALFVSAIALAACNNASKYDQQQTQVAITPKGSIVGRISDNNTAAPIEGAKITAITAGAPISTTSSADGFYELKDVTVSSSTFVLFEKDGYLRSISSASVPSSAGNAPLTAGYNTLNIRMAKGDGEIQGVLRLPNNLPAAGVTLYVDQRQNSFDAVVTAVTDMNGAFSLKGLASSPTGINHTIFVPWFDENADGQADYSPTSGSAQLYSASNIARVFITYSSITQRVVSSNIFDGELAAADDIKLTFSSAVRPSGYNGAVTRQFVLTNNTRNVEVAVEQTWASATSASVKPVSALREGDIYTLAVQVQGINGASFSTSLQFQVRAATVAGPTTPVANVTVWNDFTFADRTKFNYSDNAFFVNFDQLAGFSTYAIYAKDTASNPAYVLLSTPTLSSNAGRASVRVTLPYTFNNGVPLSAGNKISFAVVPVDGYGNVGSLTLATAAVVADNVAPATQAGNVSNAGPTDIDAINDEASAKQILLRVRYSEAMDPSVTPVFKSTAAATIAQSFVWLQGDDEGILSITVPAGVDLSGTFVIRGGKDAAGNVLSGADFTGFLGGRKELVINGGFEDATGACSLTGWQPGITGTMATAAAVAGAGIDSTGRCAALIGAPIGSAPATGVAKLTQEIVLPTLAMTPWHFETSIYSRPQYFAPTVAASVVQLCRITDTSDTLILGLASFNSTSNSDYTYYSNNFTPAMQGQTVRVVCSVDNSVAMAAAVNGALYVDNVSLALVKNTVLNQ